MITQEELKKLMKYDPETGDLFWKPRDRSMFESERAFKSWNTRLANKKAGTVDSYGYLRVHYKNKKYQLHRLIWLYVYGKSPDVIDHINGLRDDNRIVNLRNTTMQGNSMNQKRKSDNTSGVTGVFFRKYNSLDTYIRFKNKKYHLGCFNNIFDAACARKSAENKLGFSERHGEAQC